MDLKEKVTEAIRQRLEPDYVQIEEDNGISGFVVSSRFLRMTSLDRQRLIDDALRNSSVPLTPEELRQVLIIAALTPLEYEAVGAKTRVHKVKEMAGGEVEVTIRGGHSDAEYVRGALNNQKGVKTDEPRQTPGAVGILMNFRAKGTKNDPLTKAKVVSVLKKDPLIEVLPGI